MTTRITPSLLAGDARERIAAAVSLPDVHAAIAAALQHTLLQSYS